MREDHGTHTERDAAQVARWLEPERDRYDDALMRGFEPHPDDNAPTPQWVTDEFEASPWRGYLDAAVAEVKAMQEGAA